MWPSIAGWWLKNAYDVFFFLFKQIMGESSNRCTQDINTLNTPWFNVINENYEICFLKSILFKQNALLLSSILSKTRGFDIYSIRIHLFWTYYVQCYFVVSKGISGFVKNVKTNVRNETFRNSQILTKTYTHTTNKCMLYNMYKTNLKRSNLI